MTKLQALVKLIGSRRKLANIIGTTPGWIDHMIWPGRNHKDVLPSKHNKLLLLWASEELTEDEQELMFSLLENECPCCNRAY